MERRYDGGSLIEATRGVCSCASGQKLLHSDIRPKALLPTDCIKLGIHFWQDCDFSWSWHFEENLPLSQVYCIAFRNDLRFHFQLSIPRLKTISCDNGNWNLKFAKFQRIWIFVINNSNNDKLLAAVHPGTEPMNHWKCFICLRTD